MVAEEHAGVLLEDDPPSDHPSNVIQAKAKLGGLAGVLITVTAAIVVITIGFHSSGPGQVAKPLSPSGPQVTESIGSIMELTSTADILNAMLDAVNTERQKQRLPNLCYNSKLNKAAQLHSKDMARRKRMSHTGGDGSSPGDRITEQGYQWRTYAENVAAGQTSVSQVMRAWMNSPGHRRNILKSGISHFGTAVVNGYWTQKFAAPFGNEACMQIGGGSDGHGGRCRDVVPKGQTRWSDSDGPHYHCDWYARGNNCKQHGGSYKNFGYVAKQACCTCGGGCLDKVPPGQDEWYDSKGKGRHCDWYSEGDRCRKHGNKNINFGMTANQACCVCGAGQNDADPTPAPAPNPSPGSCCAQACQQHSDCQQPNLFCCPGHHVCMDRSTFSTCGPNCNSCSGR
jgi:uncharacterized protein YkwD